MPDLIRAWNNKGKSFDLTMFSQAYGPDEAIYNELKYAATKKMQLPESWRRYWRSLNEMYLSFMDPAGEIINFQFVRLIGKKVEIIQQMYFKQGNEKRELVFENVERDTFVFKPLHHYESYIDETDRENIEMSADWHMGYGTEIIRKNVVKDLSENIDKFSIDRHRGVVRKKQFYFDSKGNQMIRKKLSKQKEKASIDFGHRRAFKIGWREELLKGLQNR